MQCTIGSYALIKIILNKAMDIWILAITGLLAIIGTSVFIWSLIDTKRKYYQDYIDRKRKND